MIKPGLLADALKHLDFEREIDLFASRLNKQFDLYCSFKLDPGPLCVDRFSISLTNLRIYCFPPSSSILQTIQKIKKEHAESIQGVPDWPTQPWNPLRQSLRVKRPVKIRPSPDFYHHPLACFTHSTK